MSRINLGGGKSISIRDYAVGLGRTGTAAGAVRYAQGKDEVRTKAEKARGNAPKQGQSQVDNVGGSR